MFSGILLSAAEGSSNPYGGIIMVVYVVLILGFLYFFMLRPQKNEQKKKTAMLSSLEVGDSVLTTAGFLAFALLRDKGDSSTFAFFTEALDGLTMKFTGWQKTKVFGLTIPSDFPQVKRGFEPVLTLPGIISYIYFFITIVNVFAIINASLIYISRMIRCRQAVGEVYQKKLSNLSEINNSKK